MKKVIIIIALTLFTTITKSEPITETEATLTELDVTEIREVLKQVETNNNPDVIGDSGDSYGVLQIQKLAIIDVNERYGTSYTHKDALKVEHAERIFILYIKRWVKHLERVEGRKATVEDVVRIWNGGPNGYKRKSTLLYYNKYKKFKYLCNKDKEFSDEYES